MTNFELKSSKDGKFYFNLAGSGPVSVLLTSEKHGSRELALHAIERVRKNASVEGRFERKTSSAGKYFFVLTGDDGQVLGTSSRFDTEAACDEALATVRTDAGEAALRDESAR
jgi:uncharacterized protein